MASVREWRQHDVEGDPACVLGIREERVYCAWLLQTRWMMGIWGWRELGGMVGLPDQLIEELGALR